MNVLPFSFLNNKIADMEKKIQMVDLVGQYHRLKEEIDEAMFSMIESSSFINGPMVKVFGSNLAAYLDSLWKLYRCFTNRFDAFEFKARR